MIPAASSFSRHAVPVRDQTGRDMALLAYLLFALGILAGITILLGVAVAYWTRGASLGVVRTHLDWQIRLFWRGVLVLLAVAALHAVVAGLGAVTLGLGLVFMVVPWALGLGWLVGSAWAVVHGARRLLRNRPVG